MHALSNLNSTEPAPTSDDSAPPAPPYFVECVTTHGGIGFQILQERVFVRSKLRQYYVQESTEQPISVARELTSFSSDHTVALETLVRREG